MEKIGPVMNPGASITPVSPDCSPGSRGNSDIPLSRSDRRFDAKRPQMSRRSARTKHQRPLHYYCYYLYPFSCGTIHFPLESFFALDFRSAFPRRSYVHRRRCRPRKFDLMTLPALRTRRDFGVVVSHFVQKHGECVATMRA